MQWGIPASPGQYSKWGDNKIKDDPVVYKNVKGTLSFATSGEDSRGSQIFVNMSDNNNSDDALAGNDGGLDKQGFAPFAELENSEDLSEFTKCYEFGRTMAERSSGMTIEQDQGKAHGNAYFLNLCPKLSKWTKAERL